MLINLSFSEGMFPTILKRAVLVPIYKSGDRSLLANYRAISLLSIFSKMFEMTYSDQLKYFLKRNKLLSVNQFGFREGHSTQDALSTLYNYLLDNIDIHNKTACIYFDSTRAFDTFNHQLLLSKMYSYGIRGVPHQWISS